MLPNSKSLHTGKEPVTGSFRPPPPWRQARPAPAQL